MEYVDSDRVAQHTNPAVNQKIKLDIEKSIFYYSNHPEKIDSHLNELSREWDIERVLETNASIVLFISLFLVFTGKKAFYLFPLMVAGFLLQHAIQGWCPPVELFRRLGVRTKDEINKERYALRALRGDFVNLDKVDDDKYKKGEVVLSIISEKI